MPPVRPGEVACGEGGAIEDLAAFGTAVGGIGAEVVPAGGAEEGIVIGDLGRERLEGFPHMNHALKLMLAARRAA